MVLIYETNLLQSKRLITNKKSGKHENICLFSFKNIKQTNCFQILIIHRQKQILTNTVKCF